MRRVGRWVGEGEPEDLPFLMKETLSGEKQAPMLYCPSFYFSSRRAIGFFLIFFFTACQSQSQKNGAAGHADASGDSTLVQVHYAQGFSVKKRGGYTLIRVFNPFQQHTDTLRYALVPREAPRPDLKSPAQIIRTPIKSMIVTSTTHIALTEMLQVNQVVKGMVGAKYAYSSDIRGRLKSGAITSFSRGDFNNEVALSMNPNVVMISAGQVSNFDQYKLLTQSGIAVFVNADWLETTPLGKAEWLKVMGLLTGKEQLAQRKFAKIAAHYQQLKRAVQTAKNNPLVINNSPYKGAWFVSGGDSFTAQYLKDAQADYPWFSDTSTGGLHLSFETVYEVGLRADVWLNPGTAQKRSDIPAMDTRFKSFKSYQTGQIYNNNKRVRSSGGNDFWESGVVHPDRVLSDLITILHPRALQTDSLYYYHRLK